MVAGSMVGGVSSVIEVLAASTLGIVNLLFHFLLNFPSNFGFDFVARM